MQFGVAAAERVALVLSEVEGFRSVLPGGQAELHGRQQGVQLRPANHQLGIGLLIVSVAANHIGQDERVACQPQRQHAGQHRVQAVIQSPGRPLIPLAEENRRALVLPGRAYFGQAEALRHKIDIALRIFVGMEGVRAAGICREKGRFARIELVAVETGFPLEPFEAFPEPLQRRGVAHVEQRPHPLPPLHRIRFPVRLPHQVSPRLALGEGLRLRVEEGNHPGRDLEALLVQPLNHPLRVGEARRVEGDVAIVNLPAVVDFHHAVGIAVLDDFVGKVQHDFL